MNKMISFYKRALEFVCSYSHKFASVSVIRTVEYHYSGMVYNLSVADDETYVADGFVVHNCRSTVIPVVKEEFAIKGVTGERPAVGDKRGVVSAKSTYGGWLKKQSAEFQDEALGPERAFLFRNGGLRIDQYRDETGRTYTLKQLQRLEPVAFGKAGVTVEGNRLVST